MKNYQIVFKNKRVVEESSSMPKLKEGFARVKVSYSGICGSDIHKIKKRLQENEKDQIVVACMPLIPCKDCAYCRQGQINLCVKGESVGRTQNGSFSKYVDIPAENLYKITQRNKIKNFVLSDVLAVCIHAINKSNMKNLDKILVIGDGTVGLMLTYL